MCNSTPFSPLMMGNSVMNHRSIGLTYIVPFISAGKAVLTTVTSSSQRQQRHIVPLAAGLQQCKGSHHSQEEFIYTSIKRERVGNEKTRSNNRRVSGTRNHGRHYSKSHFICAFLEK